MSKPQKSLWWDVVLGWWDFQKKRRLWKWKPWFGKVRKGMEIITKLTAGMPTWSAVDPTNFEPPGRHRGVATSRRLRRGRRPRCGRRLRGGGWRSRCRRGGGGESGEGRRVDAGGEVKGMVPPWGFGELGEVQIRFGFFKEKNMEKLLVLFPKIPLWILMTLCFCRF